MECGIYYGVWDSKPSRLYCALYALHAPALAVLVVWKLIRIWTLMGILDILKWNCYFDSLHIA